MEAFFFSADLGRDLVRCSLGSAGGLVEDLRHRDHWSGGTSLPGGGAGAPRSITVAPFSVFSPTTIWSSHPKYLFSNRLEMGVTKLAAFCVTREVLLPTGDVGDWRKCNNHCIPAPTALREIICWWIMLDLQSLTALSLNLRFSASLILLCLVLVFDFHIFDIQIARLFEGIQTKNHFLW